VGRPPVGQVHRHAGQHHFKRLAAFGLDILPVEPAKVL